MNREHRNSSGPQLQEFRTLRSDRPRNCSKQIFLGVKQDLRLAKEEVNGSQECMVGCLRKNEYRDHERYCYVY